jgi:hypothetical protein
MPVSTSSAPIAARPTADGAKARQERRERLDRKRRNQERNAEPERIDRQQAAPFATVASDAATARIAARIGPMHGVQPNAKASPIT